MSSVEDRLLVRIEATLTKFERQMDRARKVGRSTSTDIEQRFRRTNDALNQSSQRAAVGMIRFLDTSRAGRFVIQNTSNQIADMAVQFEMGTNPMRIMSQQLPQVFGGFAALGGPLGLVAPLLGTVLAVGIPVAAMMGTLGSNSEEAAAKVSKLGALNLSGARSEIESLRDLQERYTAAVRAHQRVQTQASEAAVKSLGMELEAQTELLRLQRTMTQVELRQSQMALEGQREDLRRMVEEARAAAEATTLSVVGDPEGLRRRNEVIAQAVLQVIDANEDLVLGIRKGEAEAQLLELTVAEVARALNDAANGADGLAGVGFGNITGAANDAERLASALEQYRRGTFVGPRSETTQRLDAEAPGFFDPRGRDFGSSQSGALPEGVLPELEKDKPARRARSGGRAEQPFFGATDREIESLRQRIALLGESSRQVAEMTAQQRLLDEARKRGLDLDQVQAASGETLREEIARQARTIGDLTDQYDRAAERGKFFAMQQATVKDGLLDAITAGEGLAGTLEKVARSFARAAFEAALFNSGPFSSGGGAGLLGGLFGILGGKRAGGGPTRAGVPYLVNENTPQSEVFVPSQSGAVLNVPQAQAALRGAAAGAGGAASVIRLEIASADAVTVQDVRVISGQTALQVMNVGLRRYDDSLPARQQSIEARGV